MMPKSLSKAIDSIQQRSANYPIPNISMIEYLQNDGTSLDFEEIFKLAAKINTSHPSDLTNVEDDVRKRSLIHGLIRYMKCGL